jgi:hypothetical protein
LIHGSSRVPETVLAALDPPSGDYVGTHSGDTVLHAAIRAARIREPFIMGHIVPPPHHRWSFFPTSSLLMQGYEERIALDGCLPTGSGSVEKKIRYPTLFS